MAEGQAGEASCHAVGHLLYPRHLPIHPCNFVIGAKKNFHPPNSHFLHFYHLAFSTRCLVLPDTLGKKKLFSGLERILAFSEGVLEGCFIPRIPLACLRYRG